MEERQEKKSRVEDLEVTQVTSRAESLQILKSKRKASSEGEQAIKISKGEVTGVSSIIELQEAQSSVSAIENEVTTNLESKSFVTQIGEKELATSQSQVSQQIVVEASNNLISEVSTQEKTTALAAEVAQKELVQCSNGTSETAVKGGIKTKSLSEQTANLIIEDSFAAENNITEEKSVKESATYNRQVTETSEISQKAEVTQEKIQEKTSTSEVESVSNTKSLDNKSSELSTSETVHTVKQENAAERTSAKEETKESSLKNLSVSLTAVEEKLQQVFEQAQESISYSRQTSKTSVEESKNTEILEKQSEQSVEKENNLETATSEAVVKDTHSSFSRKDPAKSKSNAKAVSEDKENIQPVSDLLTEKSVEKTQIEITQNRKISEFRKSVKSRKAEKVEVLEKSKENVEEKTKIATETSDQVTRVDQTAEELRQKVSESGQTVTTGESVETVLTKSQTVTAEEEDGEMSRYSRSSRLSGGKK